MKLLCCSRLSVILFFGLTLFFSNGCFGQQATSESVDTIRMMQFRAVQTKTADWGHWGTRPEKYSSWTNHSNRLIPVYSFGFRLSEFTGANSVYRDARKLKEIYGRSPVLTQDDAADYMDQTNVYDLQKQAIEQGKKFVFLIVFDGMDWETTRAASIYRNRAVTYEEGRGNGLAFQDYDKTATDFGSMVTSPFNNSTTFDVNAQVVTGRDEKMFGGYNPRIAGYHPWDIPANYPYLISQGKDNPHAYTDSASSATSMTAGIKTYNGSINIDPDGGKVTPIAIELQDRGFAVGVVSSVPFCHATPACAYANNVTRDDYQDISRDLVGLSSIANRQPLKGMNVVIGGGWGENKTEEKGIKAELKSQGENFSPGNRYIADEDLAKIDIGNDGKYQIAVRQPGLTGSEILKEATEAAVNGKDRLFGLFGTRGGHLPYATADGEFNPTRGISNADVYRKEDITENVTLREMTEAAIAVMETNEKGFWLMIESGDVDWANHNNNIDDSIGAVFSGEAAFEAVCEWAEKNNCWNDTAVILTADHGHLFVIDKPAALIPASSASGAEQQ